MVSLMRKQGVLMNKEDLNKDKSKDEKQEEKKKEKEKLDPKEEKIAELTIDLQRLQAEFENYKKRNEKECSYFREFANAAIIEKLLTILDSFEMALKNTSNQKEFIKGVELIYSQFFSLLKSEGLEPIDAKLGSNFNPHEHEVLLSETSDMDEDTILEELQKGYKLKSKILRHSKVKVSKK